VFQHFSEVFDLLPKGISLRKEIMPIEYQVRQYDLHKQHALFRRRQGSINFIVSSDEINSELINISFEIIT